ncbi:MAG: carbohydrate binding domain-containing protein [Spirochaetales bacterium]|nr:carbohydrate binding domain-containing protein [Spirochaetales bacterium]
MKPKYSFAIFYYVVYLLLIQFACPAYPGYTDEPEINLVHNGDFEQPLIDGWKKESFTEGGGIEAVSDKVHSGERAVRIFTGINPNDLRLIQLIPVKPETYYRLSCWIATENVEAGKIGANISIMGGYEYSGDIEGTTDWQYVEMYFRTSKAHRDVKIGVRIGMYYNIVGGIAYFDDVRMTAVDFVPADCFYLKNQENGRNVSSNVSAETAENPRKAISIHNINLPLIALLVAIGLIVVGLNVFLTIKREKKRDRVE